MCYTDSQILETPIYKRFSQLFSPSVTDQHLQLLSREAISEMWATRKKNEGLHPSQVTPYSNASRRTRQRWKAHTNNKCSDKCRFCRRDQCAFTPQQMVRVSVPNPLPRVYADFSPKWIPFVKALDGKNIILSHSQLMGFAHYPGYAEEHKRGLHGWYLHLEDYMPDLKGATPWVPSAWLTPVDAAPNNAVVAPKSAPPEPEPEPIFNAAPAEDTYMMQHPECQSVLQKEVAYSYTEAAARVARSKAEAEINLASLTPGMMVWHAFNHEPCILIECCEDGTWTIENRKGEREDRVDPAILRPVKPNVFKRAWASLVGVVCLAAVAYHNKVNSIGWHEGGATRASTAVGITFAALATGIYLYIYGFNLPGPR